MDFDSVRPLIHQALEEDVGPGDVTVRMTVPREIHAQAVIFPKEPCVMCGGALARLVFQELDSGVTVEVQAGDGQRLAVGQTALLLAGPARSLLTGERTVLNFIQHLSGIATQTARFVQAVEGTKARILDTRKTLPGWRGLAKYAVACGGGHNHRMGLYDMVMVKDNHLALGGAGKDMAAVVARARKELPGIKVEIEADTIEQVREALAAGADRILLDNMSCTQMRECVELTAGRVQLEASGGVTLETVAHIAQTGVDFISVGALTHSVKAIDFSMEIRPLC
ncbi:MAG: carboxylating nicotinate-nucleotide diphosphorylase [Verrucomicrobiae bacterium]|nr:carboxylating nicotinate-nucleotide diphosphorylase [Verrucomicrobiae bacterium]